MKFHLALFSLTLCDLERSIQVTGFQWPISPNILKITTELLLVMDRKSYMRLLLPYRGICGGSFWPAWCSVYEPRLLVAHGLAGALGHMVVALATEANACCQWLGLTRQVGTLCFVV